MSGAAPEQDEKAEAVHAAAELGGGVAGQLELAQLALLVVGPGVAPRAERQAVGRDSCGHPPCPKRQ